MVQLMPLYPKTLSSLASSKSRLVLPFLYRLTQVVLEKRPFNGYSSSVVVVSKYLKTEKNELCECSQVCAVRYCQNEFS